LTSWVTISLSRRTLLHGVSNCRQRQTDGHDLPVYVHFMHCVQKMFKIKTIVQKEINASLN